MLDPYTRTIASYPAPDGSLRYLHACDACGRQLAATKHPLARCFHFCRAIPASARPPKFVRTGREPRERPLPAHLVACAHRGEKVREVPCLLCGERDQIVPVFACAVHGECTLRHSGRPRQKLANCLGCRERQVRSQDSEAGDSDS